MEGACICLHVLWCSAGLFFKDKICSFYSSTAKDCPGPAAPELAITGQSSSAECKPPATATSQRSHAHLLESFEELVAGEGEIRNMRNLESRNLLRRKFVTIS